MSTGYRLLMIDDDVELNALLVEYLARFGHKLDTAENGGKGLRCLQRNVPDLLILDIMLPDTDGLTLCKQIRRDYSLPIIMLTARGEVTDRIVGLELGADDYMGKPFEPRELVARIETIMRRITQRQEQGILQSGDLVLEPSRRRAHLNREEVDLTSMEFELLLKLMESKGRVLSRDRLLQLLRGIDADVYDRSIDMLISRLRQKLGEDSRTPKYIKTVRGAGYQFIG